MFAGEGDMRVDTDYGSMWGVLVSGDRAEEYQLLYIVYSGAVVCKCVCMVWCVCIVVLF